MGRAEQDSPIRLCVFDQAGSGESRAGQGEAEAVVPYKEFQCDMSPALTAKPRCILWLAWGYLQFSVGRFAVLFCSKIELSFLEQQKALNLGRSGEVVPSDCCSCLDGQ